MCDFPKINLKQIHLSEHEKDKTMQTSNQLIPYYALELDNPQHNKKVKQKRINTKWSNGINKFFHNSSFFLFYIFL